jgi:hypothetical protein
LPVSTVTNSAERPEASSLNIVAAESAFTKASSPTKSTLASRLVKIVSSTCSCGRTEGGSPPLQVNLHDDRALRHAGIDA